MEKKKVALIIPMLQPYRINFYENLIDLTSENFEWCIYHGLNNFNDGRPSYKGDVSFNNVPYFPLIKRIGPLSVVYQRGLFSAIRDYNPDIIIVNANSGELGSRRISLFAKSKKKKLILWVCSWDSGKAKGLYKALKRSLMGIYYKRGNYFIAYSSHAKNLIRSFSIPASKIDIAYNGLDVLPLKKIETKIISDARNLRIKLVPNSSGKVFLFVGGLSPMKESLMLINVFLELCKVDENIQLWIIGDGPMRQEIERRITESGNNSITYFGRIVDGVDPYFYAADWFVLPGSGGLALNQAMFWETPCITAFADGTEEDLVLDEITGYRFNQGDPESLYDAMLKAIHTNSEKYSAMQKFSKYLIEQRNNTDTMLKVFKRTVELF